MFGLWEVRTNRLRGGPTCVIYTVFVVHFVFTVEQQRAVTTLSPWAVGRRVWKEKVGMKSLREYLTFETNRRREYINITSQVQELVRRSGIKEGLCLVNAMHISASVYINDDEGGLIKDYDDWLEKLAPHEPVSQYRHNRTGEDNGDAHLKRQIMGREVTVAVSDGELDFGPWEQVFYAEFDGRRSKRVLVKIIGE